MTSSRNMGYIIISKMFLSWIIIKKSRIVAFNLTWRVTEEKEMFYIIWYFYFLIVARVRKLYQGMYLLPLPGEDYSLLCLPSNHEIKTYLLAFIIGIGILGKGKFPYRQNSQGFWTMRTIQYSFQPIKRGKARLVYLYT